MIRIRDWRSPREFRDCVRARTKPEKERFLACTSRVRWPDLVLLAKIVNGADTDNSLWNQAESAGLNAIADGFRHLGFEDDHELNAAEWIVDDALDAYCRETVGRGKADGAFK